MIIEPFFDNPDCANWACLCGARVFEEHVGFLYFGHYVCTECQIHLREREVDAHAKLHGYPCIEFYTVPADAVPPSIRYAW